MGRGKSFLCIRTVVVLASILLVSGCATTPRVEDVELRIAMLEKKVSILEEKQGSVEAPDKEADTEQKSDEFSLVQPEQSASTHLSKKEIQACLRNADCYDGPVDSKIGPHTKKAIKKFQRDHGLVVDGLVGKETEQKLRDYIKK